MTSPTTGIHHVTAIASDPQRNLDFYAGTLGLFFTLFLLFIRWIPMIAVAEVKGTLPEADPHADGDHDEHDHGHSAAEVVAAQLAGGE